MYPLSSVVLFEQLLYYKCHSIRSLREQTYNVNGIILKLGLLMSDSTRQFNCPESFMKLVRNWLVRRMVKKTVGTTSTFLFTFACFDSSYVSVFSDAVAFLADYVLAFPLSTFPGRRPSFDSLSA